ncbi:OB-fold domain-containing protein [Polaromonas sp. P1-6]|nr:OB-fold domain-containing protein [Polaromonas sp. P1-6]
MVYRIAYHASFAKRLPYTVAVVELDEGPRMFSNIVGSDASQLKIEMPLRMVIEVESGTAVPRFKPV